MSTGRILTFVLNENWVINSLFCVDIILSKRMKTYWMGVIWAQTVNEEIIRRNEWKIRFLCTFWTYHGIERICKEWLFSFLSIGKGILMFFSLLNIFVYYDVHWESKSGFTWCHPLSRKLILDTPDVDKRDRKIGVLLSTTKKKKVISVTRLLVFLLKKKNLQK